MVLFCLVLVAYSRVGHFGGETKVVTYSRDTALVSSGGDAQFSSTEAMGMENYPDLIAIFHFNQPPSDTLLRSLTMYKTDFARKYKAYMGDILRDSVSGGYSMGCDFQTTPYSGRMFDEFQMGVKHIAGDRLRNVSFE